jgi:hypothetical protein
LSRAVVVTSSRIAFAAGGSTRVSQSRKTSARRSRRQPRLSGQPQRPLRLESLESRCVLAGPVQKFITPLPGIPHVDWTITNYVDQDTTAGIRDYTGGI